jgi:Lipocalin-like domain
MTGIVGTWRLVRTAARDDDGNPMHPPYGEQPRGLLVFYADGRMMSVLCDARRKLPPDEAIREYNSYCGNYEWDGKTLVTHVDASADVKRLGTDQTRFTHFEGDLLVLTQKPRPWKGVMQHRALYWERIAEAPAN